MPMKPASTVVRKAARYERKDDPGVIRMRNSKAWINMRRRQLALEPLCRECLKQGRYTRATEVDHVEPHKGDAAMFFDMGNVQSLCHACHSKKTAREDGGFGNPVKAEADRRESVK